MIRIEDVSSAQANANYGEARKPAIARPPGELSIVGELEVLGADQGLGAEVNAKRVIDDVSFSSDEFVLPGSEAMMNESSDTGHNAEKLEEFVGKLNDINTIFDNRLEFEYDHDHGTSVIRVIDKNTDEVIREIPPARFLDVMGKAFSTLGIVVDQVV